MQLVVGDVIDARDLARHDPAKLAALLMEILQRKDALQAAAQGGAGERTGTP